jgi:CheY-like chemotaxis protein
VTNLVVNARDAMPQGGRISVRTRRRTAAPDSDGGDYAELLVADTGAGIAPEILPHIFEPFYTTKEQGKGTGLGLAIVYGIVTQNNGSIDVRSSPGEGTAFELLLPVVSGPTPGSPEQKSGDAEDFSGDATLLVAEDEPGVRGFVSAVLRSRGYRVIEAANGREALDVFSMQVGRIALLLTDVVMPEMGGLELASRVRRLRPDLPVLYMSGYTDQSMSSEVTENLLGKPFSTGDLLRRIQQILPIERRRGG